VKRILFSSPCAWATCFLLLLSAPFHADAGMCSAKQEIKKALGNMSKEQEEKLVKEIINLDLDKEEMKNKMERLMAIPSVFFGRDIAHVLSAKIQKRYLSLEEKIKQETGYDHCCCDNRDPNSNAGGLPENLAKECMELQGDTMKELFSYWDIFKNVVFGTPMESFSMEVFDAKDDKILAQAGFSEKNPCAAPFVVDLCLRHEGYKFYYCMDAANPELVSILKEQEDASFEKMKLIPSQPTAPSTTLR